MPSISAPVAAIAGGAISGGASLLGSSAQASATTSAANQANATQLQMFDKEQADEAPYVKAGTGATTQEQNLLGLNGQTAATNALSTFQSSPGYTYDVQQGLSAIDNGAASTGTLQDGNTIRAEQTLGNNLADQNFSNYYNRLSGLATTGANAAANTGSAAISTGNSLASTDASEGNQLANIYGNASSGVGSAVNNTLNGLSSLNAANATQNALNAPISGASDNPGSQI